MSEALNAVVHFSIGAAVGAVGGLVWIEIKGREISNDRYNLMVLSVWVWLLVLLVTVKVTQ